jgi:hypothetical protein
MGITTKLTPAAMGFSTHTGWAAMVAVSGSARSPLILDRRRIDMISGTDPEKAPFVYHAARKLDSKSAEQFVREASESSRTRALGALEAVVAELQNRQYEVVGSGIIVGRPLAASLEAILKSHSRIHAAEGELFRGAIRKASEALKIPVTEVRAAELQERGAKALRISLAELPQRLATIGRAAGRPWARDQKDALLAAVLALS